MIVAIIDVGSNTARLLVARVGANTVTQIRRQRHYLRLGDDVHAIGRIGPEKLREAGEVARRFARLAAAAGAERLETIVTAPGRQAANSDELTAVLSDKTKASVVQLTGDDEGRLAWDGAVARMEDAPDRVAVIDLGGGSCELAVGPRGLGADWVRSMNAGALRITRSYLGDSSPSPEQVLAARLEIRRLVSTFDPPQHDASLVVGGTARAAGRIVGRRLGIGELDELVVRLSQEGAEAVAEGYGITPERAHTLLGGTLVLAEIAWRLDSKLEVGRGGLREGAALALARAQAFAA